MARSITCYGIALVLLIGGTTSLSAQLTGRLTKPTLGTPTAVVGPSSLAAAKGPYYVTLIWPAVKGAEGYRVTRISNTGDAELILVDARTTNFVFEGMPCTVGYNCIYLDQKVVKPNTYTYRVYSLWVNTQTTDGTLVSPPSPPATVQYF